MLWIGIGLIWVALATLAWAVVHGGNRVPMPKPPKE
jgi:hypothetical protein